MDEQPEKPDPTDQPVAYDTEGRPLYYHPLESPQSQPQVIHVSRSADPAKVDISPRIRLKHERSRQMYPMLNLSDGEYVVMAVRRHPIGLFLPFLSGFFLLLLPTLLLLNYDTVITSLNLNNQAVDVTVMVIPVLLFMTLVIIGVYIAYFVYNSNKFFLTNESVIQEIQLSLFSRHEQTVGLANIEDASFVQAGIIQQLFNYGTVRLSTEGEETTYTFTFAANPRHHIEVLNNAVEAFKNGRPVEDD